MCTNILGWQRTPDGNWHTINNTDNMTFNTKLVNCNICGEGKQDGRLERYVVCIDCFNELEHNIK